MTRRQPRRAHHAFFFKNIILIVLIDHLVGRPEVERFQELPPPHIEPLNAGDQVACHGALLPRGGNPPGPDWRLGLRMLPERVERPGEDIAPVSAARSPRATTGGAAAGPSPRILLAPGGSGHGSDFKEYSRSWPRRANAGTSKSPISSLISDSTLIAGTESSTSSTLIASWFHQRPGEFRMSDGQISECGGSMANGTSGKWQSEFHIPHSDHFPCSGGWGSVARLLRLRR